MKTFVGSPDTPLFGPYSREAAPSFDTFAFVSTSMNEESRKNVQWVSRTDRIRDEDTRGKCRWLSGWKDVGVGSGRQEKERRTREETGGGSWLAVASPEEDSRQEVEDVMLKTLCLPTAWCVATAPTCSPLQCNFFFSFAWAMGPRCIFLFALRLAVLSAKGRGPFTGLRQKVVMNSQWSARLVFPGYRVALSRFFFSFLFCLHSVYIKNMNKSSEHRV